MKMRISVFQTQPEHLNTQKNLDFIAGKVPEGSDIALFPELATSGYLFESRSQLVAHSLELSQLDRLARMAQQRNTAIAFGFPERCGSEIFNSVAVLLPGQKPMVYRKAHLFGDEKSLFVPGDQPGLLFEWKGIKIGVLLCYDWAFPEMARVLALKGAQIILHPANLVLPYAKLATRVRALENRVFWIMANRVGSESAAGKSLCFSGQSAVIAPNGEFISRASRDQVQTLHADIDPSQSLDKSIGPGVDVFADRRPELYTGIVDG